jgi:DnaJ-class molecular chaperone
MDYKEAFKILDINLNETDYKDITHEFLKKKYHKQALLNHPDKNGNTLESTENFKKINEAYDYLKREINSDYLDSKSLNEENSDFMNETSWDNILKMFIMSILEGKYTELFSKIINEIVSEYKNISIKLFDGLSKDMTLEVYTFLSKYRTTFNLNDEILEKVKEIVIQKFNNVEVYKLNPSINDLLNNNVYKLYVGEDLFFVPLWHNELYFENLNREIIVFCEPELPEHIKIDDDNNIYIDFTILFSELENLLKNNDCIKINIGEKIFEIELSLLFIKKEQFYKIKKQGLTKIEENNIYDISSKGDIIVKITISN